MNLFIQKYELMIKSVKRLKLVEIANPSGSEMYSFETNLANRLINLITPATMKLERSASESIA